MNSVTTNHAGTKAGQAVRRALRSVLACALVFGVTGAAFAQQYGERRDDPQQQQQAGRGEHGARFQLPPQDRDPRNEARAYEEQQRRLQPQYQPEQRDPRRGSSRLTPDERRDLRRQINEAGIDLYPPRR